MIIFNETKSGRGKAKQKQAHIYDQVLLSTV